MALRGTLTHRKTRRLATALKIPPCFALGVIEALWHVTAEQAPCGDIGRMTNQDIADEMFFSGDADKLVSALVDAGFLDVCDTHRLVVHDWKDHADQATKRKVGRMGGEILSVSAMPAMASHVQPCLAITGPPEPESRVQSPVPEPVSPQPPEGGQDTSSPSKRFRPPTEDEVAAYCAERKNGIDAAAFVAHYEANGWRRGQGAGIKIQDWKACVRTWEKNRNGGNVRAPPTDERPSQNRAKMLNNADETLRLINERKAAP